MSYKLWSPFSGASRRAGPLLLFASLDIAVVIKMVNKENVKDYLNDTFPGTIL